MDGLVSHPGGSRDTPSRFMLQKISADLMGHSARMLSYSTVPLNFIQAFGSFVTKP